MTLTDYHNYSDSNENSERCSSIALSTKSKAADRSTSAKTAFIYLLLNRTRSTEYSMKTNNLRSQLARANVRDNVVQLIVR